MYDFVPVLFSEQSTTSCCSGKELRYDFTMDVLTVIGIFLFGSSAGALIMRIQYRSEIGQLKTQLETLNKKSDAQGKNGRDSVDAVTRLIQELTSLLDWREGEKHDGVLARAQEIRRDEIIQELNAIARQEAA